ncbi:MaoC/PaaZ C-terminal domain-containing protein [Ammonicoccus fulvus]|uniref:MaoC/PaaZ C-terminal domain-containing protein n=1 Tax=Ammonicoccus fulvus TaxID=3138240 RepID=A0ABZ3FQ99_9ACTN
MSNSSAAHEVQLTESPNLAREFARAAFTSGSRPGAMGTVPDTVLKLATTIDREQLFGYQKLCGFTPADLLPPTFPHLLGFPLQAKLMAAPGFPLPMAGLVHLRNEMVQHVELFAQDNPVVTVFAENLAPHPKGVTVDLVTRVEVDSTLAWESRSTYLRRGPAAESAAAEDEVPGVPEGLPVAKWRLPADLGRKYAAVSGDVNPIHLHPWGARMFGFKRAIAHGMWTYARTLSALGPRVLGPGESVVWFRKPVSLPSTVTLVRRPDGEDGIVAALVSSGADPKPHLITRWQRG